jgi:acyl dehydratase
MTSNCENLDVYSIGDTHPVHIYEDIEKVDFVKWGGTAGDFNPVHWDELHVRDAGLPSVFGQGMFTAGFMSYYLTEWFGVKFIKRWRSRFESRLWPGDTVIVSGEIVDKSTKDDWVEYEVEVSAKTDANKMLISGDATVEVPR